MVTELLEGETLRERLNRGPIPLRTAVDYGSQIARGLAAAHDKGIVHRDLKPENVFVTKDGRLKILDFGLAKLAKLQAAADENATLDATPQDTSPGVVLGTVGYMSPEQVKGEPADARSDIFALGTILYEMLSGQRAFRRDTSAETMTAILKEDPPELTTSAKPISPALERIVRRCLEKNRRETWRSISKAFPEIHRRVQRRSSRHPQGNSRASGSCRLLQVYSCSLLGRREAGCSVAALGLLRRLRTIN
jgi:serine/threonine protein kinase